MAYELKPNSGTFFKNTRQREGRNDPDYTGSALIDGVEYWVDIWVKNDPRKPSYDPQKKTFFSTSFRPKDEPAGETRQRPTTRSAPPPARHAPPPPLPGQTRPPIDDTPAEKDIPF